MLSVVVRWTVVEGHQRMRADLPHLTAGTAPAVTNFCESQLRHSHNPVHSNGPHTTAIHASNATATMAPVHLSVVIGQSASPADLPEPLVACHTQADVNIQRAATQLPSSPQFSPAAKRTKSGKRGCCSMALPV